jgi:hypothetical protein
MIFPIRADPATRPRYPNAYPTSGNIWQIPAKNLRHQGCVPGPFGNWDSWLLERNRNRQVVGSYPTGGSLFETLLGFLFFIEKLQY